ncbi:hypothetical protein N0V94_003150 [Neodidymelliopsis sp. IMI 364377]|nr:hypothetical protein N0V94_003150 [Neodidymelliopsis sp. IMI 364377]
MVATRLRKKLEPQVERDSDDDFVPEPKRAQKKQKLPVVGSKKAHLIGMLKVMSTGTTLASASEAAQPTSREQPLRFVPSKETRLLNKWLVLRPKLAVTKNVLPIKTNLNKTGIMPLRESPDMPNRKSMYSVKLVPIEVTWDPKEPKQKGGREHTREEEPGTIDSHYKVLQTWRIHVWNNTLLEDQQKQLRLFPEWQETATLL